MRKVCLSIQKFREEFKLMEEDTFFDYARDIRYTFFANSATSPPS